MAYVDLSLPQNVVNAVDSELDNGPTIRPTQRSLTRQTSAHLPVFALSEA
jgi:hypothetical protein